MNDLSGLRPEWCLFRDGECWVVGLVRDDSYAVGEYIDRLAKASTIAEAIEAAGVEQLRREEEQRRRDRDYAERKAAGKLTMTELAAEYTAALWSKPVFDAIAGDTIIVARLADFDEIRIEPKGDEAA